MGFPFIVLDIGDIHHMDHMMNWWGIPYIGSWWIVVWIVQFILALLIFKDADKKGKNGLLWFILIIIPGIGILFLIAYLVVQRDESDVKEADENAQNILDERYAKGEITREKYQQMKKDIKKGDE